MVFPRIEGEKSKSEPLPETLQKETPEQKAIRERRFTPQPPAGIDLSVIDPLPNETGHTPNEAEPE